MNSPAYLYIKGVKKTYIFWKKTKINKNIHESERERECVCVWFTFSALRSWKSFKTESLVDDSNALVVKWTFLFICRHGFEETKSPRKGVWLSLRKLWEEEEKTGMQVRECMFMALCYRREVSEVGKDKEPLTSDPHTKDIFRVAFYILWEKVSFFLFYG